MANSPWTWDPGRNEYYLYDHVRESYNYQSGITIFKNEERIHATTRPLNAPPITSSVGPTHARNDSGISALGAFSQLSVNDSLSLQQQQGTYNARAGTLSFPPSPYVRNNTSWNQDRASNLHDFEPSVPPTLYPTQHGPGFLQSSGNGRHQPWSNTTNDYQQSAGARELNDTDKLQEVGRNMTLGPSTAITEPNLLRAKPGLAAHRRLNASQGEAERLDPDFKIRRPGRDFFKKGAVFKVLWPELAGDTSQSITVATGPGYGQKLYVKIRWFVVVREGNDCCTCLSVQTYQRRGVTDSKIKAHHAIIYTGEDAPNPLPSEEPKGSWERPLGDPIRVEPKRPWEKLDPLSRINFVKIYTVEHNVKVKDFGYVHRDDEWKLVAQFNSHWGIPLDIDLPPATRSAHASTPHSTRAPLQGTPVGPINTAMSFNPYINSQPTLISPTNYPGGAGAYNQGAAAQSMQTIPENTIDGTRQNDTRERRASRSYSERQGEGYERQYSTGGPYGGYYSGSRSQQ